MESGYRPDGAATTVTWRPPPWKRRRRLPWVLAAAAVLLVATALAWVLGNDGRSEEEARQVSADPAAGAAAPPRSPEELESAPSTATTAPPRAGSSLTPGTTAAPRASAPLDASEAAGTKPAAATSVEVATSVARTTNVAPGATDAPGTITTAPGPQPAEEPTTVAPAAPAPVTVTGEGNETVEIAFPVPGEPALAAIDYDGEGDFAVWSVDDGFSQIDLLVDTTGAYAGTVLMEPETFEGVVSHLEIEASGPWTVTVAATIHARRFLTDIEGAGDDVVVYAGAPGSATVTHDGDGVFTLWANDGELAHGLLVDVVGPYQGEIPLVTGLIEVQSLGAWSITTA